jgi:hypothetical protein
MASAAASIPVRGCAQPDIEITKAIPTTHTKIIRMICSFHS